MKHLLLPVFAMLLILSACVSNRKFQEEVQIRDAKLETAQQDIDQNRGSINELIIQLNDVYEQLLVLNMMQSRMDGTTDDVVRIEAELADVNYRLFQALEGVDGQDASTGGSPDKDQADEAYREYLEETKGKSAYYATKYELSLLVEECTQMAQMLRELALEVQAISGALTGLDVTGTGDRQDQQAVLQNIFSRLVTLETELEAAKEDIRRTEAAQQEGLDLIRARVVNLSNGLTELTTDLGEVVVTERFSADPEQAHMMNKRYQLALAEYYRRNFEKSILLFEEFLRLYPDGELSPNAHYWMGENYYGAENYPKALREFKAVVANYPGHKKVWDAQLKVGMTHYRMGEKSNAYKELMLIKTQNPAYPDMKLVDKYLNMVQP